MQLVVVLHWRLSHLREGHLTILVIVFLPIKTLRSVEPSVQEDGPGPEISGYCSLNSLAAQSLLLSAGKGLGHKAAARPIFHCPSVFRMNDISKLLQAPALFLSVTQSPGTSD
jgi:hypothetical protein